MAQYKLDFIWRFRLFYRGLEYNYPLCCIIGFIKDFNDESDEYMERRSKSLKTVDHVMCKKCFTKKKNL